MTHDHLIFNRKLVKLHRNRAAAQSGSNDFLLQTLASRLSERVDEAQKSFDYVLDLGAHSGLLGEHIRPIKGVGTLVQTDLSEAMLCRADGLRVVADEEFIPFAPNSFDLVISAGSLHWVNDLPGALIQINRILKPGGLFLASLPGGQTLKELRQSLEQAEMNISGGLSPRVSPFVDVKDAGSLLQRAGFSEPVSDSELLTVLYADPLRLLHDLQAMGEGNALLNRARYFTRPSLFTAAMDYYRQHFSDSEGRVKASFEIVTLTGWKPEHGRK